MRQKGAQYLLFKHVQENISKTSFENSVLVKNDLIHGKHKQKERARERGARDIVVTTWRLSSHLSNIELLLLQCMN